MIRFNFVTPLLCILLVQAGCQKRDLTADSAKNVAAEGTTAAGTAASLDRVTAGSPTRKTLKLQTEQPGRVLPFEQTPVYSKLAAYVAAVHVDMGDRVTKGQTLIDLELPEYRDQLAQKKSLLSQAEAQIKQAEATVLAMEAAANSARLAVDEVKAGMGRVESDLQRYSSERQRIQQLVDKGSATSKLGEESLSQVRTAQAAQQEVVAAVESAKAKATEAQSKVASARADVEAAIARKEVAKSEVTQAETMLSYGRMLAPYDGVIVKRNVDQGHFVQPGTSAGGSPLLVLASTDRLRVCVDVPESEAVYVNAGYANNELGDPVTIRSPTLRDQLIETHVTRSSSQLDPENRSLTVESHVSSQTGLLAGTFVTVSILLEQRENVLTLPISAIVRNGNTTVCKLVVDKKIVTRPIKLGLRVGEEVEVSEGLDGTETVVLIRAAGLQDNQEVELIAKT